MGLEIKIKDIKELEAYSRSFSSLLLETQGTVNNLKVRHSKLRRYNELKKNLVDLRGRFTEDTKTYFEKINLVDELIMSEEYEKINGVKESIGKYEKLLNSNWKKLRRGIYDFIREKDRLKTNYVLENINVSPIKYEQWEKLG